VTLAVAIVGVVFGAIGALMGAVAFLRDRPRLQVRVTDGVAEYPEGVFHYSIEVDVVNVGRRPTTILGISAKCFVDLAPQWFFDFRSWPFPTPVVGGTSSGYELGRAGEGYHTDSDGFGGPTFDVALLAVLNPGETLHQTIPITPPDTRRIDYYRVAVIDGEYRRIATPCFSLNWIEPTFRIGGRHPPSAGSRIRDVGYAALMRVGLRKFARRRWKGRAGRAVSPARELAE
jgi:hypothetical protein